MTNLRTIPLGSIRIDGGTQMRADLNEDVVAEYTQTIREGGDFPPIVVFVDGSKHWLADGFHRLFAYRKAGAVEIEADARAGTRRDAILYSVGANATHGLRRTNADKRKSVQTLLSDKEWSGWSDREIARRAGVSDRFVNAIRHEQPSANRSQITTRTVERNGTAYQQDTAKIGKASPPVADAAAATQQAENDRQRDAARAALPEHATQSMARHEAAMAARRNAPDADGDHDLAQQDRLAELEEAVKALEVENARLAEENRLYGEMRAEWLKGGFAAVIAGRDKTIRGLHTRIETESSEKVANLRRADRFLKILNDHYGHFKDQTIDLKTGEVAHV